ncbi:MAG: hypothetical protein ACQESE_03260 [Nanobdellota archaeon]
MAEDKKRTIDSHIDIGSENLTYRPKPSIVDLSEKYDLPDRGSTDCDFDRVKELLFKSHQFSEEEIARFKKSNDIRYFMADLDTGDFSIERTKKIIDRYKQDSEFRREFNSLIKNI